MTTEGDWSRLLHLYQHSKFGEGNEAVVSVSDEAILEFLREVDGSPEIQNKFNIVVIDNVDQAQIGDEIAVEVGATQRRIGLLVDDPDAFVQAADVRFREPARFFVKSDGTNNLTAFKPDWLVRYRAVVAFTSALSECALYTDETKAEIVFFRDGRLPVPVSYDSADLQHLDLAGLKAVVEAMAGEHHADHRNEILSEAISSSVVAVPRAERFRWILQNAADLAMRLQNGYKLFISSFSYEKVRGEVQKAQSEYLARIHKTFVDIQGQLLGLPVATVVVASQLKSAKQCGVEAWTNLAVLGGSYLFVLLFIVSCINQGFTLFAIRNDVGAQKRTLETRYAAVSDQFIDLFGHLSNRIGWHYMGLFVLCFVALLGAVLTTMAYGALTQVNPLTCK